MHELLAERLLPLLLFLDDVAAKRSHDPADASENLQEGPGLSRLASPPVLHAHAVGFEPLGLAAAGDIQHLVGDEDECHLGPLRPGWHGNAGASLRRIDPDLEPCPNVMQQKFDRLDQHEVALTVGPRHIAQAQHAVPHRRQAHPHRRRQRGRSRHQQDRVVAVQPGLAELVELDAIYWPRHQQHHRCGGTSRDGMFTQPGNTAGCWQHGSSLDAERPRQRLPQTREVHLQDVDVLGLEIERIAPPRGRSAHGAQRTARSLDHLTRTAIAARGRTVDRHRPAPCCTQEALRRGKLGTEPAGPIAPIRRGAGKRIKRLPELR